MLYIILGIIFVIFIILIIISISYNKFRFAIIKIDEAENNIEVLLQKKIELLDRTRPIIMKELKLEEFLDEIEFLKESKINHFEMNNSLKDCHTVLVKTLDDNEKLLKSETLVSVVEEINSNEEAIVGCTKFYNDSVVEFNRLVGAFPSNIVAFLWRYKRKEFYNNEKREMYEILNEK
ncbi:MAG: LemA family protein [Mycoplasmatota bacterium]|nr:LemA family protein [Mycoplasmatota bacterium]